MKKIMLLLSLFVLLVGCANQKPMKAVFDEEEVKKKAEDVIYLTVNRKWDDIRALCYEETRTQLKDEVLEKVEKEVLDPAGKFIEIEKMECMDLEKKGSEENFALVLAKTKFEDKTFLFQISFNEKMEMVDYFMK